jgi:UDPglucose--hexose-1-phosphate uridylyltransferase
LSSELRRDPISRRIVIVAPGRARRPGLPVLAQDENGEPDCPFCEEREGQTPPEVFALGPPGRASDTPGWRVRVVPNKFPALAGDDGRQEVVVHTPRHARSLAELTGGELDDVALAWRSRAAAARDAGFRYVHAFVNEGRAAGASLPHTHSQLLWLPDEPPLVAEEWRGIDPCALCAQLARERDDGRRVVVQSGGLLLLCPYASRGPFELLVAPLRCEGDAFASELLGAAVRLAAEGIRRLRRHEGPVPFNAWLHTSRLDDPRGHWHVEILPRLTVLAGLELGTGLWVNTLPPEDAVKLLGSTR